jgi:ABC-type transport system involved in multi-copper enzyme maturation permease subunit
VKRSALPLLRKELLEQAARPRTYVVRVVYAAGLLVCFGFFFREQLARLQRDPTAVFGTGKAVFELIVNIQFAGIFLFLPAMMAGVVTAEKERATLSLLLLTDLTAWEIVLQKYLGRLVPMAGFLLLSLPLLALAYSFGRIGTDDLQAGVFLLFLACFQVGALALMFSAYCRTTLAALVCTYVLGAAFFLLFPSLVCPPVIFARTRNSSLGMVLLRGFVPALSTFFFLARARRFLVRRAFAPPGGVLLRAFQRLDAFWTRLNDRLAGGIVLLDDGGEAVGDAPVAWRETHKKALGRARYLGRVIVFVELAILVVLSVAWAGGERPENVATALVFALWVPALLVAVVQGVSAFVGERAARTLDVLLATPMTGAEIVRQKARGLRRTTLAVLIPFVTLFILEAALGSGFHSPRRSVRTILLYILPSSLAVFVYLSLFGWVALRVGLRTRARGKAIVLALGITVGWIGGPVVAGGVLGREFGLLNPGVQTVLQSVSPAVAVACLENSAHGTGIVLWVHNLLLHALALLSVRTICLARADRDLGRAEPGNPADDELPEEEDEWEMRGQDTREMRGQDTQFG